HKPVAYQENAGIRREVQSQFVLLGNNDLSFQVGTYDVDKALVIDPVLSFSTYLGGSDADGASAIAVDSAGNAYVAGSTKSIDFPISNALQPNHSQNCSPNRFELDACSDVFIAKLTPDGSALVYSTYVGGNINDAASVIAVDKSGNVYVTGRPTSADCPALRPQ